MESNITTPDVHSRIDALESALLNYPEPAHSTLHRFTPGLYSRTFIMPAGSIYTSKQHKTEHQFAVLKGLCSVKDTVTGEWQHIRAPFLGITKPGTRRVLVIHEETVWTTFHPTDETDLEKLEALLIEPRDHSLQLAAQRRAQCLGSP